MDILFPSGTIAKLLKAGVESPAFKGEQGYGRTKTIDSRWISSDDVKVIRKTLKGDLADDEKRILRKLAAIEGLEKKGPKGKVTSLEALAHFLRATIQTVPRQWVFLEKGGSLLPWFVTGVRYSPASGSGQNYVAARTRLSLQAMQRGEKEGTDVSWSTGDLPGPVSALLAKRGVILATEELLREYDAERMLYEDWAQQEGEQFNAQGFAEPAGGSRWSRDVKSLGKDGEPARVVIDDFLERKEESDVADVREWIPPREGGSGDEDGGDDGDALGGQEEGGEEEGRDDRKPGDAILLPVHPVIRVFDLRSHEHYDVHVSNLTPYAYDASVIDKLVLPAGTKRLIDALTGSVISNLSDVIRGKAQGVIVLCSGVPGTGKTLTAEVYSEAARRPLYLVQCSQLGTDEEELEKKLGLVLERATRWRAILLIDEADVYVRERGEDIQQNAIVGVFLRLLEYYSGILFLTTNRVAVVDDAILSRVTAHVKYVPPKGEERARLWRILLRQYLDPTRTGAIDNIAERAVDGWPAISGRSMRQLIRLGLILAKSRQEAFSVAHMTEASKFHDFSAEEQGAVT